MIRFKTKEEFIKEFGDKWRSVVSRNFIEDMDPLLGKEFIGIIENGVEVEGEWYSVSNDMLIEEDDYKSPLEELFISYLK